MNRSMLASLAGVVFLCGAVAYAQTSAGSLGGTITDPNGAAIPDAMYVPEMECGLVATLLNQFPVVEGYLWDVDNTFMSRAQVLHDSHASDATNFVVMLDLLAKEFGLTHPEGHFTPAYLTGYR